MQSICKQLNIKPHEFFPKQDELTEIKLFPLLFKSLTNLHCFEFTPLLVIGKIIIVMGKFVTLIISIANVFLHLILRPLRLRLFIV